MYYDLITKPFINGIKEQNIDENKLVEGLNSSFNYAFSTFPYIFHKNNSKEAIKNFNSGNCISLSMHIKDYLKKKYKLKSYLIPASVPDIFNRVGYLDISHVALAVPKNKNEIYILDPAFYFIQPMKLILNSPNENQFTMKNIYSDTLDLVNYKVKKTNNKLNLNKFQKIPKDTYFSECNFINNYNDKWNYYLREIKNPDMAISSFFINLLKYQPFITKTKLIGGDCKCEIMIKFKEDGAIDVKHFNKQLYYGNPNDLPKNIIKFLNDNLNGFFDKQLKYYLNLKNIKKREIKFE